jgi:hypothetical protein
MSRTEFSKATKREALKRAGGVCEAIGVMYGLPANERCANKLSYGVEFDHIILDANSKNNSLENCCSSCIPCHKFKTTKHDTPMAAKTVRQRDKDNGIKKRSSWQKPPPGFKFSWRTGRMEKTT